jgi:hypothetical protein
MDSNPVGTIGTDQFESIPNVSFLASLYRALSLPDDPDSGVAKETD